MSCNEDIRLCQKILCKEIYSNNKHLIQNIELVQKLNVFLLKLNIPAKHIKQVLKTILFLRTVNDDLYDINLTIIIPSLNPVICNAVLNEYIEQTT
jgi:hypothetical protein